MTENPSAPEHVAKRMVLGKQFRRLGWFGFWVQIALLIVPLVLMLYAFGPARSTSAGPQGIDSSNYLSYGSLVVLIFTTFWFFRYTRLSESVSDSQSNLTLQSVERTLWVGVWASSAGIVFSILLMFNAIGRMLFVLLANPQTGIQIAPTLGDDPTQSLSAIDAVSLSVLLIILVAELIVMGLSLWLLFRTTRLAVKEAEVTA